MVHLRLLSNTTFTFFIDIEASMRADYDLITILGPTACGKTKFAVQLATELDAEIISADSRQVYRSMDIGTGKDITDYHLGDKFVPYHLIDIVPRGKSITSLPSSKIFFVPIMTFAVVENTSYFVVAVVYILKALFGATN